MTPSIDLAPFLAPRSVAVVGAGERPTSSGGAVLAGLRASGYRGRVWPINPKGGLVFGVEALPSLAALPSPADLVVVAIRPDAIPDAVRDGAEVGHKAFLILPGGFAEAGDAGRARDRALGDLADRHGLAIAGPNCAGIIRLGETPFAASFLRDMPPGPRLGRANVALVSQSGAIAEEVIAAAHRVGLSLATVVSVGNAMRIGLEAWLDHLGRDPETGVVLLYVEAVDDASRFAEIARRVALAKPVVALVGGRTAAGARAAARHTGAVANDADAIDRYFEGVGVVRAPGLAAMVDAGRLLARHPDGFGNKVLILSNSGGPGVLCADAAVVGGLDLPSPPAAFDAALRAQLPDEAAIANPIDLLADAREDRFGDALAGALDAGYDAILGIHVVPFMVDGAPVVARMAALAADRPDRPVLHSMMGTLADRADWFARLEAAGVVVFADAEAMATAAALAHRRHRLRDRAATPEPAFRGRLR
jgi:acetyltransferase